MSAKHKRTLEAIFKKPTPANINWDDIEKLFKNLGATIREGSTRLAVELHGVRAYFHRPHPEKETDKGAVASVRRFLENAGVTPC